MQWSADFESGLADIDAQHRYIFALLQRLSALKGDVAQGSKRYFVEELRSYAQCHFECEERLMVAYNYPEIAHHVEEHAKLLFELKRRNSSIDVEPQTLSLFLCDWIMGHTLMEDRQLAAHIVQIRSEILGITAEQYSARLTLAPPASSIDLASDTLSADQTGT